MLIRIVRNTLAAPTGQPPRPVDAGETIDVPEMLGQQLIALGKAVAVDVGAPVAATAPHLVGIEHAIDGGAGHAERRTNWGEALITAIDGIGPKTAQLLATAGIETMAQLLAAPADLVAQLTGASSERVEKWRQRAQAVLDGQ
jgi:predicted flap endonuclease-1-like 5' DNA nuclease